MRSCPRCGTELEGGQICGCNTVMNAATKSSNSASQEFVASMKNRMGIGEEERNATDVYERGMKIVPECIGANENEIPVKQYDVAVLRNLHKYERAEGRMQVTNKRVIFRAAGRSIGGRTTLQHEFAVDEIAGIEARRNFKFSLLYFVFANLIALPLILIWPFHNAPLLRDMMSPQHILMARAEEHTAILHKNEVEQYAHQAALKRESAQETERRAIAARETAETREKNYRPSGWYDQTAQFREQRVAAQAREKTAVAARESAEAEERSARAQVDPARVKANEATKKRESAENTWKIFMTLLGIVIGIGALIPFFVIYKRFGLKLFILNLSYFGFALSLTASGSSFFFFCLFITSVVSLVCTILFCFRPNLVISIKNKGGFATAVDIRRDTFVSLFTKQCEKGTGFFEVMPTKESERAIREIGAIVGDIQKLGDFGVEKWVKK